MTNEANIDVEKIPFQLIKTENLLVLLKNSLSL